MENRTHILIVDDLHSSLLEGLTDLDITYTYLPQIHATEIPNLMGQYNGLVVRSKLQMDKCFLQANSHLKVVVRAGSGMDNIDLETADQLGITCINCPEANCDAVGEQTVGMLLGLAHNIVKGNNEIGQGVWDREGNRGFEIGNKTIGIIGYGHTGSAVARKLYGFKSRVLAYDKYKEGFASDLVAEVDLDTLLEESDVISFHVPLTSETEKWVSTEFIEKVKKPFVLLNLSRGGIMKTNDVIQGLKSGKVLGFGSDVLENEKLSELSLAQSDDLRTLTQMDNVVLTPHIGGWTVESYKKISDVLVKKLKTWIQMSKNGNLASRQSTHFVG